MESNLWRPRPNLWPLMCVGSSNPAGSREEGVGTGKETPAGQDGTTSGDTPLCRRQPGPGRHQWLHTGVLGAGVPAVAWGTLTELFFPLMSSLLLLSPLHPCSFRPTFPYLGRRVSGTGSVPEADLYPQPMPTMVPTCPWAQSHRAPRGDLLCSGTRLLTHTASLGLGQAALS